MSAYKKVKKLKGLFTGRKNCSRWAAILILATVIWFLKYDIIARYIPKRFGVVEQGSLYRSGQLDEALVRKILIKYKIGLIISLSGDSPDSDDQTAERQAAEELGIKRLLFPLKGNGTGDIKNYAGAIFAICQAKKEHKPVLVHCAAGAQRTGGVIATYELLIEKKDVPSVFAEMKHYGAKVNPDSSLMQFLNSKMGNLAELLKQMGLIKDIPNPLPQITCSSS